MTLNCYFHADREANTKCELCGKLICLECKMVLKRRHGTEHSSYISSYDVCPLCFYDKMDKGYGKNAITVALLTTIPAVIFIILLAVTEFFFPMIIAIAAIAAFTWIYALFYAPKKRKEFNQQKKDFLQSLKKYRINKVDSQLEQRCGNCGAKIEPNTSICSYCGNEL